MQAGSPSGNAGEAEKHLGCLDRSLAKDRAGTARPRPPTERGQDKSREGRPGRAAEERRQLGDLARGAALSDPRLKARLTDLGGMVLAGSPPDFDESICATRRPLACQR